LRVCDIVFRTSVRRGEGQKGRKKERKEGRKEGRKEDRQGGKRGYTQRRVGRQEEELSRPGCAREQVGDTHVN